MKIGIFDSGIGGLNVLNEILKEYPYNTYYYYGDTKNLPYGNKSREELFNLACKIIKFLEAKEVDIIIIACGTISSNCYQDLKKVTNIPLYDIITPTINYLKKTNLKDTVVFATERTIASHIFKNALTKIEEIATPEFVPMIEENKFDDDIIKKYLLKIQTKKRLVLGCTHYPLLLERFLKYFKHDLEIVDMGKCLTKELNLTNAKNQVIHLYFSQIDAVLEENIKKILKVKFTLELKEVK